MSNSPVLVVVVVWFTVVAQLYFLTDAVCRCLLPALFVVVVCGTRNFAAKLLVSVSAFSLLASRRSSTDAH